MGCGTGPRTPVLLALGTPGTPLLPLLAAGWRVMHIAATADAVLADQGENYRAAVRTAIDTASLQGLLFSLECEAVLYGAGFDEGAPLFEAIRNQWEGEFDRHQIFALDTVPATAQALPVSVVDGQNSLATALSLTSA